MNNVNPIQHSKAFKQVRRAERRAQIINNQLK